MRCGGDSLPRVIVGRLGPKRQELAKYRGTTLTMISDSVNSTQLLTGSGRCLLRRGFAVVGFVLLLAGCAATTTKHGHHFNDGDVQQVQPGMSQEAVRMALGTPDTTSTVNGGNTFYYISSTTKQTSFFKPDEVDRKVLAVYFNRAGSVEQVSNYGMKDGQVVDFNKGETQAYIRDRNFIQRFFRGVGPKQKIAE